MAIEGYKQINSEMVKQNYLILIGTFLSNVPM